MKAFVGCLYVMGITKLPSINAYWEKDSTLFCFQGISVLFSRTRFSDIYTSLCLRDPILESPNTNDYLFKINSFVETIIAQCKKHYVPDREVTIDESMIPFRGRSKLIQYMPLKPIKYGLKAFLLCEAKTGYVLQWKLFTGDPNDVHSNFGLTYQVIRDLVLDLEGNQNILYTDRYYTGLQIYHDLKMLGIGACGTLQMNRSQLPEEIRTDLSSLRPQEIMHFKTNRDLLLSCWKDSNLVMVLSNCFGTGSIETSRRKKKKRD